MHRLSNGTQVASFPVPAATIGTPGFATGGVPGVQAASVIDPDAFNSHQEELVTIVLAAALILDKANNTQVLQALQILFASVSAITSESASRADGDSNLQAQINALTPASSVHSAGAYDVVVVGAVRILTFTTTAYDGQQIDFPVPFSDTPSAIDITSSESQDGNSFGVLCNIFKDSRSKNGFKPHLAYVSGSTQGAIPSTNPVTINVRATGPV